MAPTNTTTISKPASTSAPCEVSTTLVDELRDAATRIDAVVATLDPSRCDANAALDLLGVFSRVRKTAAAGEALIAARVDECSAHESTNHRSTAHLVADVGGTTIGKAREAIETAKRLRNCSATDAAIRSGAVSVEQAAAVTSAAAVDPSAEAELLRVAGQESLATLTQRARTVRLTAENDRLGVYRRQYAARSLRHGITDDGMVWGHFQLPPDTGATVVNTLEREADRVFRSRRSSGDHEPHDRYVADALVSLLSDPGSIAPTNDVDGSDGDRGTKQAGPRWPQAEVVVHVSHAALVRGSVATSAGDDSAGSGEICMIQGVGPVPMEVARDIAADAFLKGVLVDGTDVVKIKHFGRRRPAELQTALEVREVLRNGDVRCASDGCDATLGLEWDHVDPVARGGTTTYENMQPLCRSHHRRKTRRDGRSPPTTLS